MAKKKVAGKKSHERTAPKSLKKAAKRTPATKAAQAGAGVKSDVASVLTIRRKRHPLKEVLLYTRREEVEGEACLTIDLFADSEKNPAGFAINGLLIRNVGRPEDLQQKRVSRDANSGDPYNELAESVIVEQGETLELQKLALRFGKLSGRQLEVTLKAVCENFGEDADVPVRAAFRARLMGR